MASLVPGHLPASARGSSCETVDVICYLRRGAKHAVRIRYHGLAYKEDGDLNPGLFAWWAFFSWSAKR